MGVVVVISPANQSRISYVRAWLEARAPPEEILVPNTNADAANDLVTNVALGKGAAFGWHRTLRFASLDWFTETFLPQLDKRRSWVRVSGLILARSYLSLIA